MRCRQCKLKTMAILDKQPRRPRHRHPVLCEGCIWHGPQRNYGKARHGSKFSCDVCWGQAKAVTHDVPCHRGQPAAQARCQLVIKSRITVACLYTDPCLLSMWPRHKWELLAQLKSKTQVERYSTVDVYNHTGWLH